MNSLTVQADALLSASVRERRASDYPFYVRGMSVARVARREEAMIACFVSGNISGQSATTMSLAVDGDTFRRLVNTTKLTPVQVDILHDIAAGMTMLQACEHIGLEPRRARRLYEQALVTLVGEASTFELKLAPEQEIAEVFRAESARQGSPPRILHCKPGHELCADDNICKRDPEVPCADEE